MLSGVWDWLFHASLTDWSIRLLHVSVAGQVLFVGLWLSLPWWRSWVGRALMAKSFFLCVLFVEALVFYYLPPWSGEQLLGTLLFAFVTLGIWSQVLAIAWEMWRGRRARRRLARKS